MTKKSDHMKFKYRRIKSNLNYLNKIRRMLIYLLHKYKKLKQMMRNVMNNSSKWGLMLLKKLSLINTSRSTFRKLNSKRTDRIKSWKLRKMKKRTQ